MDFIIIGEEQDVLDNMTTTTTMPENREGVPAGKKTLNVLAPAVLVAAVVPNVV